MSWMKKALCGVATFMAFTLLACAEPSAPEEESKIETVDELLLKACELASDCVPSTREEIEACPSDLILALDGDDIAELERFTTLDRARQNQILECFDAEICGRFGVALTSISDSDLMEPLLECEVQTQASGGQ